MEGFSIGKRERLDGGRLSIYVSHRRGRWGLMRLALRALFHRLQQASDFDALTAQSIVVETRRPALHVATDGEVCTLATPLEYRIRPGALRVLVPRRVAPA
jgi:diacylglycerol kinase family enzyme